VPIGPEQRLFLSGEEEEEEKALFFLTCDGRSPAGCLLAT
jgi:hypothetical protein